MCFSKYLCFRAKLSSVSGSTLRLRCSRTDRYVVVDFSELSANVVSFQAYVGLSRVRNAQSLRVLVPEEEPVTNVVYKEVSYAERG